ncbi:MAG: Gmad2 immunoglobulin-like domain-containing protein [Microbacteriaceae bacterium]
MPRRRVAIRAATAVVGLLVVAGCANFPFPPPTAPPSSSPGSAPPSESPSPPPAADAITIDSPQDGTRVQVPVEVSGMANTFEAALTVDLLTEAGDILCMRHIMATSGSGTPGTWQTRLGFAPQGDTEAPVTLRAYELSANDGSITNLVERPLTLSPEHPPIMLTSPICGDVVAAGGALAVQGLATVFEAALTIELRDAAGATVLSRNLMTAEGGVESLFGEFVTVPAGLAPGFYDLVAFNYNPEDGSIENEFPVQIAVR